LVAGPVLQVLLAPQSFSSIAPRLAELGVRLLLTEGEAAAAAAAGGGGTGAAYGSSGAAGSSGNDGAQDADPGSSRRHRHNFLALYYNRNSSKEQQQQQQQQQRRLLSDAEQLDDIEGMSAFALGSPAAAAATDPLGLELSNGAATAAAGTPTGAFCSDLQQQQQRPLAESAEGGLDGGSNNSSRLFSSSSRVGLQGSGRLGSSDTAATVGGGHGGSSTMMSYMGRNTRQSWLSWLPFGMSGGSGILYKRPPGASYITVAGHISCTPCRAWLVMFTVPGPQLD
jgi:hypothetical protein